MTPNQNQIPQQERPPEKLIIQLQNYLKNGIEMVEIVQKQIEKWKLPYTVEYYPTEANPMLQYQLKATKSRGELHLDTFITIHEETLSMLNNARKIAVTKHEVLITGETGTGKEIIAKSMIGERIGHIRAVNCAGLPENLIESELFGHVKGAFTGAEREKQGLMAAAQDGVFFLDEVGELPLQMQAKLLRALQEKRIRRVGGSVDEDINCKFVCATHRDLKKMVKEGTFRQDLYARIGTLELDILPLHKRTVDVIPITKSLPNGEKFLSEFEFALVQGKLDLSLNVRSLQQWVIRFDVFGSDYIKKAIS